MKKKIVKVEGFEDIEFTMENLVARRCKQIVGIETEETLFKANDLDSAMRLWAASGDKSKVIGLQMIG
jgi:hypothetical protein